MRKVLFWIIAALVAIFVALAIYIRVAGNDEQFHFDPAKAEERGKENDFIVSPGGDGVDLASPVFDMSPEELMRRFHEAALSSPSTRLVSEEGGYATFVQRTKL